MDASTDRLLVDHLLQQLRQAGAVGLAHAFGQLLLVGLRDYAATGQGTAAYADQIQGPDPAVLRVGPALDETSLLELVDERDHAAGRDLDAGANRLLGLSFGGVDQLEDAEQRRVEVDLGDPLGEAARGVDPHLREQESEGRWGAVAVDGIAGHGG